MCSFHRIQAWALSLWMTPGTEAHCEEDTAVFLSSQSFPGYVTVTGLFTLLVLLFSCFHELRLSPPIFFFFLITQSWILRSLTGVMKLWYTCSLPCVALHFLSKVLFLQEMIYRVCFNMTTFCFYFSVSQFKKNISICVVLCNFLKHFTSISFDL